MFGGHEIKLSSARSKVQTESLMEDWELVSWRHLGTGTVWGPHANNCENQRPERIDLHDVHQERQLNLVN